MRSVERAVTLGFVVVVYSLPFASGVLFSNDAPTSSKLVAIALLAAVWLSVLAVGIALLGDTTTKEE